MKGIIVTTRSGQHLEYPWAVSLSVIDGDLRVYKKGRVFKSQRVFHPEGEWVVIRTMP